PSILSLVALIALFALEYESDHGPRGAVPPRASLSVAQRALLYGGTFSVEVSCIGRSRRSGRRSIPCVARVCRRRVSDLWRRRFQGRSALCPTAHHMGRVLHRPACWLRVGGFRLEGPRGHTSRPGRRPIQP